jgi:hypothetical protein
MDSNGVNIDDATNTCAVIFRDSGTEKGGIFWSHTLTEIQLYTTAGNIDLWPNANIKLKGTADTYNVYPASANTYSLGTSTYYWKQIHGRTICVNAGPGAAEALTGAIFYEVIDGTYWWGCYIAGGVRSIQFTF